MSEHLFLFGPCDGEVHDVYEEQRSVRRAVFPPIPIRDWRPVKDETLTSVSVTYAYYERFHMQFGDERVDIFVPAGTAPEVVGRELVKRAGRG